LLDRTSVRLPEQRVGLVEQQDRVAGLGGIEHRREVLLGLADPLRDHLAEIHLVQLELEVARDQRGDHRLAGAGRPREQRRHAEPLADLRREAPLLVHPAALAHARDQLGDRIELVLRQHQIVPALRHRHPARVIPQPIIEHAANSRVHVVGRDRTARRPRLRRRRRVMDQRRRERVLRGQILRIARAALAELA
jgi:hypothetical protein